MDHDYPPNFVWYYGSWQWLWDTCGPKACLSWFFGAILTAGGIGAFLADRPVLIAVIGVPGVLLLIAGYGFRYTYLPQRYERALRKQEWDEMRRWWNNGKPNRNNVVRFRSRDF